MFKYIFINILCVLFSLTLFAQANLNQLTEAELADHLINQTCGIDTENALKTKLSAKKIQAVEPLLIKVYEDGPSKAEMGAFEKNSKQRYDMIQRTLKSGRSYGLAKEDLDFARKQSWEDFYALEKEKFVYNSRSQALTALARTRGEQGMKTLNKAAQSKSDLQKSAKAALKLIEN